MSVDLDWRKAFARSCLLVLCCLLTTGCWDRKEIETRGYVLGIAIDMAEQADTEIEKEILQPSPPTSPRKYKVSFEMRKFRSQSSGAKPGTGEQESLVYAAEGESLLSAVRAVNTQFPSGLFFEHNQLLLFSEAVARNGIREITDFLERDPEFRRRAKIFVTPGRAEKLFELKTKSGELSSTYIARISRNVKKAPTFATTIEIGLLSEKIENKQCLAVPLLISDSESMKATGAALFNRQYKMVDTLDETETVGAKILRRKLNQGIVVIPNPVDPDKIATFELFEEKIKVEPHLAHGELWFQLDAEFFGSLAENQADLKALDANFLAALEEKLAQEITRQIRTTYKKLQTTKTDVIELGFLVHKKYPKYWKTVKEHWDEETFPAVPLKDVRVKVSIRHTAMTN